MRQFRKSVWRFLDQERGTILLKKEAPVRFALVYPNRYALGMANLGFQTVYRLLNEHPEVRCERAFMPDGFLDCDIRTLESGQYLYRFDVVGFSLSFELDLPNLIQILIKSRISPLSKDRTEKDPFVFVGGVVPTLNPSLLLPFVDGLFVGECEEVLHRMADVFAIYRTGKSSRKKKLRELGEIEGVFIPGLSTTVKRQVVFSLEEYPTYTPIVTPLSHFEEMFVVEVGRGCTRGCFFCAAQKVYHPYRFRSSESIIETVVSRNPGSHRIGLEGASLSDFPDLKNLCESLVDIGYEVSFSSIRPDRVTSELIEVMDRGKIRSFAIAPEAGPERLRKRIGKGISDEVLRQTVRFLKYSSVEVLKLYFLIGLPDETEEDIEMLVKLVREMGAELRAQDRRKRIRVSVNSFIPKPFTEFQWAPMDTEKILLKKRKQIIMGLKKEKGVTVVPKSTRAEILQGVLSLGDEGVGLAMMDMVNKEIPWKKALKEKKVEFETFLHRERSCEEVLPWDFIQTEIPKEKLWERYQGYYS